MVSLRRRASFMMPFFALLLMVSTLLAACGNSPATGGPGSSSKTLTNVSIGLGYNPDIQFAPFYVAKSKGYYKDVGLNVTFNHGIVPDLVGTMIAGKNTFVFASGDEMLEAINQNKNLQITDVSTIYQEYPVSLIVPASSSIKNLADIKGHTIGVPGPYGATYTGLLALLHKANLAQSDVKIQTIGFNQVAALLTHKVDAVVGYSNNEPLQIASRGLQVRTFDVADYYPLVSNGIIATNATYKGQSQMVKNFVAATIRGVNDVINDPNGAVTISQNYVPALNTTQALSVLKATIPVYKGSGKIGYNDSTVWQATEQFLVDEKMISPISNLSQYYTNLAGS
jgi:NitT/TauT family transport system substrate-binding protein